MSDSFQVVSGKVVISDPCYELDDSLNVVVEKVKIGTWIAQRKMLDKHIVREIVLQCGFPTVQKEVYLPQNFCIDSGQVSVFDAAHYRKDNDVTWMPEFDAIGIDGREEGIKWYNAVSDLTLKDDGHGYLMFGFCSDNGVGDIDYQVKLGYDKHGQVVQITIRFRSEEDGER